MSNAVFPTNLIGLGWPVTTETEFSTSVQEATSGFETRIGYWTRPKKKWTLKFQYLPDERWGGGPAADYATLRGFHAARFGKWDSFLFYDQFDSVSQGAVLGVGDGTTTAFQLQRPLGTSYEQVYDQNPGGYSWATVTVGGTGYGTTPFVIELPGGGACLLTPAAGVLTSAVLVQSGVGITSGSYSIGVPGGSGTGVINFGTNPLYFLNGASTAATVANGLVTFASAPGSGVSVTADFAYYWRCRFDDDSLEFSLDMHGMNSLKKVVLYQARS